MPDPSRKRTESQNADAGRRRARVAKKKKNRDAWEITRKERAREALELKAEVMASADIRKAQGILNQVEQLADKVDTHLKLVVGRMSEEALELVEDEIKAAREGDARARRWVLENLVKWAPKKETSHSVEERARDAMAAAAAQVTVKVETDDTSRVDRITVTDGGSSANNEPVGRSLESPAQTATP